MARIIPSKAPNLPLAPGVYDARQQEQFSNALRLYFARVDSNSAALLGPLGTKFLNSAHVAASDSTDQFALADDSPTLVRWNTLEARAGFILNPDSSASSPISATFKIDYSLQLVNTDNASHDVFVWLQVNGGPLANSSSRFTVPARKSAGVNGFIVAYSSAVFVAQGGDSVKLWWATEKAYNAVGPVNGVYIRHIPAQTVPYVRPANPSAIGSIVLVSCPCDLQP